MSKAKALPQEKGPRVDGAFWGVSLCFLLSGVAGLIYQMVWMRYLSTIFGTSELAIVTVLVAYMGGLALGSGAASRVVHRLKNPIRLYAILEAVIAASALLVPMLLKAVGGLQVAILGGQEGPPADGGLLEALCFLGLGCLVLFIPTFCMGATLPILASGVVKRRRQIGRRVGWLYALNTFGAVLGTVLAAFYLIPKMGLWQTSFVGVFLNLLVAVLGWFVALRALGGERTAEERSEPEPESGGERAVGSRAFRRVVLGVMFISGALSFAYEILWSRLLGHVLGGSLYAFATMLAAFLAGIAIGGLIGARLASHRGRSCYWLAGAEVGAGLLSGFLFLYVGSTGFTETAWGEASFGALVWMCVLLLMPATLCIGATFPLAVRALTEDPLQAGRSAGSVYSWNTIGAILGAVGAGYFLIPALGYAGTFKLVIAGNLLLGTVILASMSPRSKMATSAVALLTLVCLVGFHPKPPLRLLTMSPSEKRAAQSAGAAELVHHAIGHSASVAVLERHGSFSIRTNGLPEAEIFSKGAEKLSYTRIRWLPALPMILRPSSKSLMVVGFGGGTLLEAVPPGYESIDVLELEEEVIRANKLIADRRAIDPFQDERIKVIVNDARGALRLTDKRYDAIVSQPSHPWTAGASHLYTLEFLELVHDHLTADGVFVQWLGAHFVNEELLRSFAATMLEVFPHTQLYKIADNFLFVGASTPLDDNYLAGAGPGGTLFELSDFSKIALVEDVLAVLQLDEEGVRKLAADHPAITDNKNGMATHQSMGKASSDSMADPVILQRVLGPLHYLNQKEPRVLRAHPVQYSYLIALLSSSGAKVVNFEHLTAVMPPLEREIYRAISLRRRDPRQALSVLSAVLTKDPDHALGRALEVQIRLALARKNWVARGLGPAPHDIESLIATDQPLASSLSKLRPEQHLAARAQHWLLTGQLNRLPEVAEEMKKFTDHRDPFFQVAARIRVEILMSKEGKTEEQLEVDTQKALALLDHLLVLPTIDNGVFINYRIELSRRTGDVDYLVAAGWIMARKLAGAPKGTPERVKAIYRKPLGEILRPYASVSNGRLRFSNEKIQKFHNQVRKQLGAEVFSPEFRK